MTTRTRSPRTRVQDLPASTTSASTTSASTTSASTTSASTTSASTAERWTAVRVEELEQLRASAARPMTPAQYSGAALATVVSMVAGTHGVAWTIAVLEHLAADLRDRPDPTT